MYNSTRGSSPTASGGGADRPGAVASTSAAASAARAAGAASVPRSEVDELFRMGFPRAVAARALRRSDGTVDGALDWLAEHPECEQSGTMRAPGSEGATGSSAKEPTSAASVAPNVAAEEGGGTKVSALAAGSVAAACSPSAHSEAVAHRKTKPVLPNEIEEPPFSNEPPVLSATRPAKKSPAVEASPQTDPHSPGWEAGCGGRELHASAGPVQSSSGGRAGEGAGGGDRVVAAGAFQHGTPTRLPPSLEVRTGQGPLSHQQGVQQTIACGASDRAGNVNQDADTVMTPVAHAVVVEGDEEERGARASGAGSSVLANATPLPPAPPAVRTRWMKISLAVLAAGLAAMGVALGLSSRGENGKGVAASSQSFTAAKGDTLKAQICSALPSTCDDLSTEGTPQSKALDWLVSDSAFDSYANWRRMQWYVLAVVAFSLEGWGLNGIVDWRDGGEDECSWIWGSFDWDKILCDSSKRVTHIGIDVDLVAKGKVPRDVALLSESLEELDFCCVEFSGSIPTELGMLSKLRVLSLFNNKLTGSIPTELGQLSSLEYLNLYNNTLAGSIPTELGQLSNLEWLVLERNDLTGSMPGEVCELRTSNGGQLQYLGADCTTEVQCDSGCCTYCY